MTISVAILDDHRSFAGAISLALELQEGIEPVGTASSVDELVKLARTKRPAVVLVDYQLAGGTGLEAAKRVRENGYDPRLILLTSFASPGVRAGAVAEGFEAVLGKEESVDSIVQVIRNGSARIEAPASALRFSRRQREVLDLMGQGLDPASIAESLFISVHTARSHVKDVLRVLGASSQLSAVTKAIREGYLLPPSHYDNLPTSKPPDGADPLASS